MTKKKGGFDLVSEQTSCLPVNVDVSFYFKFTRVQKLNSYRQQTTNKETIFIFERPNKLASCVSCDKSMLISNI